MVKHLCAYEQEPFQWFFDTNDGSPEGPFVFTFQTGERDGEHYGPYALSHIGVIFHLQNRGWEFVAAVTPKLLVFKKPSDRV